MKLILLGPPGSGKGTQSQKIVKDFGIIQLSTGEILRNAISTKSVIGFKVKNIIDKGDLVPDSLVVDIIAERINKLDCSKGFILDGFPRNLIQAKELDKILNKQKINIDVVILLEVKRKNLFFRIKQRAIKNINNPRTDDNIEIIKNRFEIYHKVTVPLIKYYDNKGVLKIVDGMNKISIVTSKIKKILTDRFN